MKQIIRIFMAIICLLAISNQADAQLIIRNNGHVEIGTDPFNELPETMG